MKTKRRRNQGFSLLELMISMTIMMTLLAMAANIFRQSIGTRQREMQKTDAVVAVHSALNLISREIAETGYGLKDNGLVLADCNATRVHFRSNIKNQNATTGDAGEDLVYSFDPDTNALVRYDRFDTPQTSTVIKKVTELNFKYFNFDKFDAAPVASDAPNENTGRVRITISIALDSVDGQPADQKITYSTDVTLRNSEKISTLY